MPDCDTTFPCRLLHTLRVRYTLDMIYTYSGNILIAVSPSLATLTATMHHRSCYQAEHVQSCWNETQAARSVQSGTAQGHSCMVSTGWRAGVQANPHKRLRSLYGARMMTQYRGIPLGELSPHAYAIAEQVRTCAVSCALLCSRLV